ncbi:TPA: hypothetical protein HA265_01190, partial [Candidatus Woesearchaeota archaeon]|nr:hypothetical protein [Candidatus Woesearchaeota archaeon]
MSYFSLMLAPLEGITGPSFRSVCHKYGADLTFTEMSRIDALARNNQSTLSRLSIHSDTPTVIQLFGLKESDFSKFLKSFSPPPGFRGFNLNLGCPASGIIRLGMGCAMIRRVAKTQKIVKVFRDLGFPVSV